MSRLVFVGLAVAAIAMFQAQMATAPVVTDPTIAQWTFDSAANAGMTGLNTVQADVGTGTATQLGMTNSYTYASGEGPGSVANCDTTTAGVTGDAWRIRGNSNTAGAG